MLLRECACGQFAHGRCAACGAYVCTNHSKLVGDKLLCNEDADRARRLERDREEADLAAGWALRARYQEWVGAMLDAFVGRMAEAGSPGAQPIAYREYERRGLINKRGTGKKVWTSLPDRGWMLGSQLGSSYWLSTAAFVIPVVPIFNPGDVPERLAGSMRGEAITDRLGATQLNLDSSLPSDNRWVEVADAVRAARQAGQFVGAHPARSVPTYGLVAMAGAVADFAGAVSRM